VTVRLSEDASFKHQFEQNKLQKMKDRFIRITNV